jgi:hypothetical protein
MNELLTWITFAVVQLILVVFAGFYTWRRPVDRGRWLGVFLIVGAMVLLVLNAAWVLTGGPEGVSAIPMRGGVPASGCPRSPGSRSSSLGWS